MGFMGCFLLLIMIQIVSLSYSVALSFLCLIVSFSL